MIERIAYQVTHKPKTVLTLALLLLIPSLIGFIATRINYDILDYLPQDLDSARGVKILEDPFKMAATNMLIIEDMPADYGVQLKSEIEKVDGVSSVIWLPGMLGIQVPQDMLPEDIRKMSYSDNATMMIIQYENAGGSDETMAAIKKIRKLCNQKCFLAGMSALTTDLKDLVLSEIPFYILIAVAITYAVLSLSMTSWVLPGIFLASIGLAILYNLGTNFIQGEISYITLAITAVLQLGVTMDYSIFLYHRYQEEMKNYDDKRDAMEQAVIAAFTSVSASSLTTVAGFLALVAMRLLLGKDIGIVMAKGVVFGVLVVILVLPAMLLQLDGLIERFGHPIPHPNFSGINRFTIRHKWIFVAIFAFLIFPAYVAQSEAPIYYKIDATLPDTLPSKIANAELQDEFEMASYSLVIVRDDLPYNKMKELNDKLGEIDGVTSVVSMTKFLGHGIPDFFIPEDISKMLKQDGMELIMVNSEYEAATDEANAQSVELNELAKQYDEGALVTGEAPMTYDLIDVTAEDFSVTSVLSILLVLLIIAVTFRSLSVPIVLVAAIEFAVFMNLGCHYVLEDPMAFVAPTVISCIQLGATVDYSILLATRFQEELRAGKDRKEAIFIAANSATPAILTSSMILFLSCLGVGAYASIGIIGGICTMLSRGALISALVSIFITPSLLLAFEPLINVTTLWWRKEKPINEKRAAKVAARKQRRTERAERNRARVEAWRARRIARLQKGDEAYKVKPEDGEGEASKEGNKKRKKKKSKPEEKADEVTNKEEGAER